MSDNKIHFKEWEHADLRVGKILKVEDHPNADKLYILTVDLGEEKPRTIIAGLKTYLEKEELEDKLAIFVANLAPITLRGIESNGMILAAISEDENNASILSPLNPGNITPGDKVR